MRSSPLRSTLVLAALAALALPAASQNLIAYYKADGDATDYSGNGHDGSFGGSYVPGVSGSAFDIAASHFVDVPASPAFGFGTGDFTLSVWADFNSISGAGAGSLGNTFMGQDAGGGTTNKWVFYDTSDGRLGFHINSPSSGGIFLASSMTANPTLGAWNLFTLTRTGSTFDFYYDGQSIGSDSSAVSVPYSGTDLTMGMAEGIGQFNGALDDVRIYNGALSAVQVEALYNPVPEPTTLAALGVGALALLRRRR